MSFFILISLASLLSWLVARLAGRRLSLRDCMRYGMALGFLFTGVDHFANGESRYVPMIPEALAATALYWVYFTGAAELLGAIGLLLPIAFYQKWGWPNLRRQAGIWLAVMLACIVVANINVAIQGQSVQGLDFGAWYYWIRPLFQPVFILWALYGAGVWPRAKSIGPGA
jgi:uncharacterized membrane protein